MPCVPLVATWLVWAAVMVAVTVVDTVAVTVVAIEETEEEVLVSEPVRPIDVFRPRLLSRTTNRGEREEEEHSPLHRRTLRPCCCCTRCRWWCPRPLQQRRP